MNVRRSEARRPGRARATLGLALVAAATALGVVAGCGDDEEQPAGGGAGSQGSATQPDGATVGEQQAGSGVTDYLKYTGGKAGPADKGKSPIAIGWVNQQGGSNDVGPGATKGAELAVKYVNDKLGGVDGHPIELHTCFTSTAEEQGQACGQRMTNDAKVQQIAIGAVALGAQSLQAAINGEKPMTYSVSVGASDPENRNGYILFGDTFHVLAPWGTFGRDVLKAKSAALIYPEVPGILVGANAMAEGLKKAGLKLKRVGYPANATDLVGPLAAVGASSTDMIVPQADVKGCVNLAKAIESSGIDAPVVSNPLCLNPEVAKALGGDVPKWYYGIASTLATDTSDPAAVAFMKVAKEYGLEKEGAGDVWIPIAFAQILTHVKWMNAIGADKLSAQTISEQAKAFKGPMAFGAPTLECGKYSDAPAVCNDQTKFYRYEGKGKFTPAAGWVRPPE
jgi:branched-chain amino acid transport system substrate-binding protein